VAALDQHLDLAVNSGALVRRGRGQAIDRRATAAAMRTIDTPCTR